MTKLTLNMNVSNLGGVAKSLLPKVGLLTGLILIGLIGYSAYFASNLFFARDDLDSLSRRQDTVQTKQIKFNQKTLESLESLIPSHEQPTDSSTGRSNPFAPL